MACLRWASAEKLPVSSDDGLLLRSSTVLVSLATSLWMALVAVENSARNFASDCVTLASAFLSACSKNSPNIFRLDASTLCSHLSDMRSSNASSPPASATICTSFSVPGST
eukprot:10332418-Karenia_brevis.AAC.1